MHAPRGAGPSTRVAAEGASRRGSTAIIRFRVIDVVDPDAPENGAIIQIEHEIRSCVKTDGSKYKSCPLREV